MVSEQLPTARQNIDPGLRIIYRLLATKEARSIIEVLYDYTKLPVRHLMEKSGLKDRETKFYIVIREVWENGLVDKEVDQKHNVTYSINNFGKELFEKSKLVNEVIKSKQVIEKTEKQTKTISYRNSTTIKSKLDDPSVVSSVFEPNRLQILKLLQHKEMIFDDMVKSFNINKHSLSQHLDVLKKIGIINRKKVGDNIQYSINRKKLNDFHSYIESNLGIAKNMSEIIKEKKESV